HRGGRHAPPGERVRPALILRQALAQTRRSRGALAFCVASIAVGVAALTAVNTLVAGVQQSMASEARTLLGADLSLSGNQPLDSGVATELGAELIAAGGQAADVIETQSMLAPVGSGAAPRLVRIRALRGRYPFYGKLETLPPGELEPARLAAAPRVIVHPEVARQLRLATGDKVKLGQLELEVAALLVPGVGSPAAGFGFSPPVYIHADHLAATGLVRLGSRVNYTRLFRMPEGFDVEAWKQDNFERATDAHLGVRTSREAAASVQRFLNRLSRFLAVAGLSVLLLGALGVASATHAFVRKRLDSAAILRCLGARPRDVFAIFAVLVLGVGLLGSAVGALIGALAPLALESGVARLGSQMLPAQIQLGIDLAAIGRGVGAGVLASAVFGLLPVVRIARVPPLRALRRDVEPPPWLSRVRDAFLLLLITGAAAGAVLLLAAIETQSRQVTLYFAGAVGGAIILLALLARAAMALTRRLAHRAPGYRLRQGLANLHRPGNQTTSVIVAIGLGSFLVGSLLVVAASIENVIAVELRGDLPNVFLVDVQPDDRAGVEAQVRAAGARELIVAPMVAARLAAVQGRPVDTHGIERDASRRTFDDSMRTREYFLTYRDHSVDSEEVVAGEFWRGRPPRQEASLDSRLAQNLGIELGQTLTLDVQGLPLDAVVTSFRTIRWQAMRPNAMVVLSPGEVEKSPAMFVSSFRIDDPTARARLAADLVARYPNISVIDLTEVAAQVRDILDRIALVVSALALVILIAGAVILGGAIASTRATRVRETTLLKVLGARRRDLGRILVTEYLALAVLAVAAGGLLGQVATRWAVPTFFETEVAMPAGALALLTIGVVALNVTAAVLIGRGVMRAPALELLRDE
ncbi:MAG TPA: FtsX-like permease family protein, partial [Kofleriaceae bacterium]|nr:FtsX-like permease family protein [Kofleriaceae bacterium]